MINLSRRHQMLLSRIKMKLLLTLPDGLRKVLAYGKTCYCPVCESQIRGYERFGHMAKAWCPVCGSMRWQRLGWLFLQRRTNLFDGMPKKMLHLAPEIAFEPRLKKVANLDYVTGDLLDPHVMVQMDATDIPFADCSFDAVFCSHVMEHIPEDRKAMGEFFRVLNPNGWAVFMVPIRMDRLTDEDLAITDPQEREQRFGQYDHVRYYGRDFEDRLKTAGFQVSIVKSEDIVETDRLEYLGIKQQGVLFYCQKT